VRCEIKLKGGDIPDREFDAKQLEIGTQVETEHTDDLELAKQVAKGHLIERRNYYSLLTKAGL
jgi:hypothetical protein